MASSVFDQVLQQHMWTTDEMHEVFSETNRIQKWFDFEAALAAEQGALGVIPAAAAQEIAARADVKHIDLAELALEMRHTRHPVVPAVRALQRQCKDDLGEYVHFGPTSQDVYDTGMMLQVRQAHGMLVNDLVGVSSALAALATSHKHTTMAGRTHAVQALPITFGHKCAIWLAEIVRHLERIRCLEARTFVGQMVGAVGTQASFGEHAAELERRVMTRLGLGVPEISWQPARDRLCEYVGVLGMIGATLGKIANAIMNLEADEIGELAEPFHTGKIGSSTMPHKRNPAVAETVVTLSRAIRYSVAMMHDAQMAEHERDVAAVRMEWKAVPEACMMAAAMLQMMRSTLDGLEVNVTRMRENLDLLGGFLMSERVMFALSEKLGKQTAHEHVYAAAMTGMENGQTFEQALLDDPAVRAVLSTDAIAELLDPTTYVGRAPEMIDTLLAGIEARGGLRHPA